MSALEVAKGLGTYKSKYGGGYMACCPAHKDTNPSLSIDDGVQGVVFHCLAGCPQEDVLSALRDRGLWSSGDFEINHPSKGKPDQVWTYHNQSGQRIGYACRFNEEKGKAVLPYFKHADGWRWQAPKSPRSIYNLHKLTNNTDKKVLIVEGEKCADKAEILSDEVIPVTWQGGSNAVDRTNWTLLAGREVVIWPDNDNSGMKALDALQKALTGIARKVYVVELRDVAEGWDIADAVEEGWSRDQLLEFIRNSITDTTEEQPSLIGLEDITDLLQNPVEPSYLIDGVMEDQTTGALFGESTAGKSFIALDMACCIATSQDWAGHPIDRPGSVIYFAGEGRTGIPRRVKAWEAKHNTKINQGYFYLPRVRVEFDLKGARLISEELAKLPISPALIVIDTVSRSLPVGSDENSAKDMTSFINAIDSIRDRLNCVVCLVHHTGHGTETQGRARGSSAFRAAMDWEILVDKKKQQIQWTKMKDSELPNPLSFELVDSDQSATVEYTNAPTTEAIKLTTTEKLGKQTLITACGLAGNCDLEAWREAFYSKHTGDSPNSKRGAFNRARTGLVNKGIISVNQDIYSITVTSVTDRYSATSETVDKRYKRYTPHRGVTAVTPTDSLIKIDVSNTDLGVA